MVLRSHKAGDRRQYQKGDVERPRGASLQACRVGFRADFLKAERNLELLISPAIFQAVRKTR
jgi:hypothetical protein